MRALNYCKKQITLFNEDLVHCVILWAKKMNAYVHDNLCSKILIIKFCVTVITSLLL